MIEIRLREGERLAYVPSIGLAQRIVPAFPVTGFPAGLVRARVRRAGKHVAIGLPAVTNTPTAFIRRRNVPPQLTTGLFTAISKGKGANLSGAPTQGGPHPPLLLPRPDKAPHFIQLQFIARSRRQQRVLDEGSLRRFFLTRPLAFAGRPQRPAQFLAGWAARSTPPESGFSQPRYTARWDSRPRSSPILYSDTAACPWDYARFSQSPDSDSGDSDR
jgi:hypothetical protein